MIMAKNPTFDGSLPTKPYALSILYDPWLLLAVVGLLVLGLVMVASASIVISERQFGDPFHYLWHQLLYVVAGLICAGVVLRVSVDIWQKYAGWLLVLSFILLVLVLVPGIGRQINGGMRWIGLGPIGIQVSECVKFFSIIYMADYLVRRKQEVQTKILGFLRPMVLFAVMALLLLKEPDFGAASVILSTALGMMFLAGVQLWQFALLLGGAVFSMAMIALASPYRVVRLTTFLNPWAEQYNSGYQLTQSLIAFGRGGWSGVGLGESVQKLFYLPEAHTDFLFAVLAEELGLIGVFVVIALFILLLGRIFRIAHKCQQQMCEFPTFCTLGIALWFAAQAMINIGVNTGILPTKGLTLPLMSYGGSSMIVLCVVLAFVFRIDYETRLLISKENWGRT